MNAFQFFCALIIGTIVLLYTLKYVYETYFVVCSRCEAERITVSPVAEDGEEHHEEDSDDDDDEDDIEW